MLNFSKSREDLRNKTDVQHTVICDWLRTIDNKLNQLKRQNADIIRLINEPVPGDEGPPDDMEDK